ncbi:hypothetical protein SCALIN_C15_0033 [Candidatus Scalindua japonica]|uniref:NACHT domain-containing protein n=1 Tax=Candidatus Scalindua japonica TaxID=1284222 RepID=A0A286TYD1_9BACT|nr:SUMF1/EgtB/PvdO family nonheme iron enzyme [Candidatus Scalindua japonica]GAX60892.1 hypothetical protein SCALIN_C15_0033 [Candidatus Scalindua japonica]
MAMMEGLIGSVIFEIVKGAGTAGWKEAKHSSKVLRILNAVGLKPEKPDPNFDSVYAHTLVAYGVDQPEEILKFFNRKEIKRAFEEAFRTNDISMLESEADTFVEWNRLGDELRDSGVELRLEFARLSLVFNEMVDRTRTPVQTVDGHKLDEIIRLIKDGSLGEIRECFSKELLPDYLRSVAAENSRIDIKGIFSRSGSGRQAINFPIEEIYTPLKTSHSRKEDACHLDMEKARAGERVPLTDLLSTNSRLLIVGDPGGGKTTFMKLIAGVLAKDALGMEKPGRLDHLGLSLDKPAPVPVFIRLAALADTLKENTAYVSCGESWRKLIQVMENIYGKTKATLLKEKMDNGGCALLLDGLDEVAENYVRDLIVDIVNSILSHWGKNLIVISSRPFGYHDIADIETITTAHIDAFGKKEIIEFLDRWCRALFQSGDGTSLSEYLPALQEAIVDSAPIRKLARNPVMLTYLCVVHWNERKLPHGKADLLAAVLRWLLNAREENRQKRGYTNVFAEECFKVLAMAMTCSNDGKQVIVDLSQAAEQLNIPFSDIKGIDDNDRVRREGMRFLEEEMLASGIIEKYGPGRLRFWHLNFQEHFTARALVDRSDEEWWDLVAPQLFNPQWREVLDHLAGCLAWTGVYRLHMLVKNILAAVDYGDLSSLARSVGVLGRLLRILEVYDYKPPTRLGWEKAQTEVMDIFTVNGAKQVSAQQRIDAAEALGQAGDHRLKLDPDMLPIPDYEGVELGKYLVTVVEYQRFVDNEGYHDHRFWEDSWDIKQKGGWEGPDNWDEQLDYPNRPVIHVSWYEVRAYCSWLSEQTGDEYRLPSEREWKAAAHNSEGEYPWGNTEPDDEMLNFNENVGRPTPVGIYPAGAAPGGHLDMAGNVWEWCEDDWHSEEKSGPDDSSAWVDEPRGSGRVIRGGSWSNDAQSCRSAYRYRYEPDDRNISLGFRLSRSFSLDP